MDKQGHTKINERERDLALRKALQAKQIHDKRNYTTLRNKVIKELRLAKATLFINKIREGKGNCKVIWDQLKKLTGKGYRMEGNKLQLHINGCLTQDAPLIASTFNEYFIQSVKSLTYSPPLDSLKLHLANGKMFYFPLFSLLAKIFGDRNYFSGIDFYSIKILLF